MTAPVGPFPDLASVDDLQVRLGVTLSGADLARASAAITDMSALARGVAEQDWPTAPAGVPYDVAPLVLAAAMRRFKNPDGWVSETAEGYSATRASAIAASDVFTPAEMALLIKLRPKSGLWRIRTTRGRRDWDTGFVNDQVLGSDPIGWYSNMDPGYKDASNHYPMDD